jgi:hypothetical protein
MQPLVVAKLEIWNPRLRRGPITLLLTRSPAHLLWPSPVLGGILATTRSGRTKAMAKGRGRGNGGNGGQREVASDYRYTSAKRKNNPPATLAAEGVVPAIPKAQYSYGPRLPPVLRFDPDGKPDALPELLADATRQR